MSSPVRTTSAGIVEGQAVVETALGDQDERQPSVGLVESLVDQPGGDVVLAQHLDHPLCGAVPLVDGDHLPAGGEVGADVRDHGLDVAAVGLGRLRRPRSGDGSEVRRRPRRVEAERADPPPRLALVEHLGAHLADPAQGRSAEVDRRRAAGRGGSPAGAEELLAGGDQVVRAGAHALRVEDEHVGLARQQLDEHLHLVDEHRRQRLHPLDGDALGELVGDLAQLRVVLPELGGARPDLVGQEQLAARRRPETLDRLEGALVGDREGPDLVDLVAEELHAERVLLGRREDVDDAAAHGELAALLDEVDAGVRRAREPAYDVLELHLVTGGQLDRREVGQPLHLWLEHRAHRGDHDLERARCSPRCPGA